MAVAHAPNPPHRCRPQRTAPLFRKEHSPYHTTPLPEITTYKRESAFAELSSFDPLAKDGHFIEVTLWNNGKGFDVHISPSQSFLMTWSEFKALKKLIKELDK